MSQASIALSKPSRTKREAVIGPLRVEKALYDDMQRQADDLDLSLADIIRFRLRTGKVPSLDAA
jgi:hypothetical protein